MYNTRDERPAPEFDLADRLRKSLREAGLSVNEMSRELQVTRFTVTSWINGRHYPNSATLVVWAGLTGVPLEWLREARAARRHPAA